MRRAALSFTLFTALTTTAAFGAYATLPLNDLTRPEPGAADQVIIITVPAADLARCQATLAEVLHLPLAESDVARVSVDMPQARTARCEAE
ncbi:hypothetical protein [Pseudooceanicola sp.]|uniref:hypothetical protein n=1 Tax=Pseudooceanicola sp. TaxID=1914328 RepID=UPI002614BC16|nr:hypothetical protein [Pseudooceanicola sp.]MDF1853840.1 hypothetical protein [Pseudooceanicola sp.]